MYYLWGVRRLIHPVNNTGPWITLFFCPAVWLVCIKSFLKKATHMELWHQPPGKHLSLFSLIQWFSSSTAVCFIHHFTSMCLLGKRLFSSRWNSRDSGISFWIFFFFNDCLAAGGVSMATLWLGRGIWMVAVSEENWAQPRGYVLSGESLL